MTALFARLRLLVTGHAEWLDEETGDIEVTKEPWSVRWAIAGPAWLIRRRMVDLNLDELDDECDSK
jgi:hypothetical protein